MGSGAHDPWALVEEAASAIATRTGVVSHDVAVVLGSGWGPAAPRFGELVAEVPVEDLPGFVAPTVEGHGSTLRSMRTPAGRHVLVLGGRVHLYEGHAPAAVVHGVRVAVGAGCRVVVVTNAAGGLRPGMFVGQPVLIADHLNLTGASPLTGANAPEATGYPRFTDLTMAYSARLRAVARQIEPSLEEGVYAGVAGPEYETPAEIRMLQTLGADLVGMSTVHEVIAANHAGAEVLGLSLVTNLAAGIGDGGLDHADVLDAGEAAADAMGELLAEVVARL